MDHILGRRLLSLLMFSLSAQYVRGIVSTSVQTCSDQLAVVVLSSGEILWHSNSWLKSSKSPHYQTEHNKHYRTLGRSRICLK